MAADKQDKSNEKSPTDGSIPAHVAVGSNEFTKSTGSYPIRLPDQPQRASGGFLLEKFKDLYDYYWNYYRMAPTRVATRFFWSENGWDYLREFTSIGMWTLDVDAPVPQRLAAGLGLGFKASLFIYAVTYGNLRTRYQIPRNAAIFRALRPCAFFTATCLIYSGSWPLVRAIRGYPESELGRDIDAAIVGAVTGVAFSAMWIRNSRFVGISLPLSFIFGGISAGLYNAAHSGYATKRETPAGWGDSQHWRRGNFIFGPSYEDRLAHFQAQMKDVKYKEFIETSIKTRW